MTTYATPADVAALGGRGPGFFARLAPADQNDALAVASEAIDLLTGQDGGLALQTDKQWQLLAEDDYPDLVLPNKPITGVTDITVVRPWGDMRSLPLGAYRLTWLGAQTLRLLPTPGQTPTWPGGRADPIRADDVILVTYSCGLDAPYPARLRRAVAILTVTWLLRLRENAEGYQQLQAGGRAGVQIVYGDQAAELAAELVSDWVVV
jgi:hypothetical protein